MAAFFLDASAVVKCYILEIGSTWTTSIVNPASGNLNHLAGITGPEVVSAIVRRQRSGSISGPDAALLLAEFRREFLGDYLLVDISPSLVAGAMNLAQTYGFRGSDAIQLAAAMEVAQRCQNIGMPFTLLSADAELNAAAAAEGMTVDDPNNHP
jgi:predicted nucleic acid-binding protein